MFNHLKKITLLAAALWVAAAPAAAESIPYTPYHGYSYNWFGESVPAPAGYEPEGVLRGEDLGVGGWNAPQDMMFAENGDLYILDSGNGRILVLGDNGTVSRVIEQFIHEDEALTFKGACGLFVDRDGTILVADTENHRVIVADEKAQVRQLLTMPKSDLIGSDRQFEAQKVMRNPNGMVFVLVKGINEGAITYRPDGSFGGFFASNAVAKTADVITDYLWSMFMTDAQNKASKRRMPSEFTNFDIDKDGFIYTVTASAGEINNVQRLNYLGGNILEFNDYGDSEWDRKIKMSVKTRLVDIDVDDSGYMVMIDESRGHVFEYTEEGALVAVVGAMGDQTGNFKSPVAVETRNGRLYVMDDQLNTITIFRPTPYTAAFKQAYDLYNKGEYAASLDNWHTVLKMNSNSNWAYMGIGQALAENEQYRESLSYFRRAYDAEGYSNSFREVRKDFIKQHFIPLILGLVIAAAGLVLLLRSARKRLRRKNLYARSVLETTYTYPLYTAIHPYDGFDTLKRKNHWSFRLALCILVSLFVTLLIRFYGTGFAFTGWRLSEYNVLYTVTQAFLIITVWSLANWAVCTLIEGKGRLKDIFCMSAYALVPFIIFMLVSVILSNILILQESAFLSIVRQIGIFWTAILLLTGLGSIHQFGFSKTLLSVVLTLLGIIVIIFLLILFFGLLKQVVDFITSIFTELRMK